MQSNPAVAPQRGRDLATGVGSAVTAAVIVLVLVLDPTRAMPRIGITAALAVTTVMVCCGIALAALIRSLSARPAWVGQWLRRSSAGALVLVPAMLYATRPFMPAGWDFDNCGRLVQRNRTTAGGEGFRLACDAAAGHRLLQVVIWAAIGCAAAAAYGLWLRRRGSRAAPPAHTAAGRDRRSSSATCQQSE